MHFKDIIPLIAIASAAPMLDPRALIIKTVTDEVVITITDYTTVYAGVTPGQKPTGSYASPGSANTVSASIAVPPAPLTGLAVSSAAIAPPPPPGQNDGGRRHSHTHPVPVVSTPAAAPPAVVPTLVSTLPAVVPTPVNTPPAVIPSSVVTAPVVQPTTVVTTTPVVNPSPTDSGNYPTLTGATNPIGPCTAGSPCSGDITYYGIGLGACGYKDWATQSVWTDNDYVVALSWHIFGSFSNGGTADSLNQLCNRQVKIKAQTGGRDVVATVIDRCAGCDLPYSLDLSNATFAAVAPQGDGRVHNVEWEWV